MPALWSTVVVLRQKHFKILEFEWNLVQRGNYLVLGVWMKLWIVVGMLLLKKENDMGCHWRGMSTENATLVLAAKSAHTRKRDHLSEVLALKPELSIGSRKKSGCVPSFDERKVVWRTESSESANWEQEVVCAACIAATLKCFSVKWQSLHLLVTD